MSKEIQFVKNDWEKYVSHNKYLVANYTAGWCGPCQAIKPIVDQLYNDPDRKYAKIEFVRVDLDKERELAGRYQVSSIPTFIFLVNGEETKRIQGANVPELTKLLDEFSDLANNDSDAEVRQGNGSNGGGADITKSVIYKDISSYIPKGYELLNDYLYSGQFESLNTVPLYKNEELDVKNVFRINETRPSTVYSDSDSQLLFYIPFTHITKVYSVLLSFKKPESYKHEESMELDEEDLQNETQVPNLLKVWPNHNNIISFDDANDSNAPHIEEITVADQDSETIWYEAKLKFVRFQKVQSLNLFIDGEDQDYHTLLDKVVIIGVNGESKDQGKLE